MIPTKGRIVIYRQSADRTPYNETREHPAVITRVWSERCVNLTVFFDAQAPVWVTSVERIDEHTPDGNMGWRWPERT